MKKNKININQVLKIFVVAVSASIIRLVPSALSVTAKQASWISPILAIIVTSFDIFLVSTIFKKLKSNKKIENLNDAFDTIFGKAISKILVVIYIIWSFILMSVHLRFFGERIIATLFTYAPIEIFIVALLAIVYISSRKEIKTLARFCEVTFIIFSLIAIFMIIVGITDVKIEKFLPITIYDTVPIIKGATIISSIFSTGFLFMFFGEEIKDKQNLYKNGKWLPFFYALLCLLTIVITVGRFGDRLTSAFIQPFFMAIKKINIFNSIENIESIFISFWLIADFAIMTYYAFVISYASKNLVCGKNKNIYITPIIFITYILANGMSDNYFELAKFSANGLMIISLILCYAMPMLTYFVALFRGLLKSSKS